MNTKNYGSTENISFHFGVTSLSIFQMKPPEGGNFSTNVTQCNVTSISSLLFSRNFLYSSENGIIHISLHLMQLLLTCVVHKNSSRTKRFIASTSWNCQVFCAQNNILNIFAIVKWTDKNNAWHIYFQVQSFVVHIFRISFKFSHLICVANVSGGGESPTVMSAIISNVVLYSLSLSTLIRIWANKFLL